MTSQRIGVDKLILGICELNLIELKANIWMDFYILLLLDTNSFEILIHLSLQVQVLAFLGCIIPLFIGKYLCIS